VKWIANDLIAVMEPSPSQHPILRFWSTVVLLVSFGAVVVVGGVFFALSRMGEAPSTPADKTPEPQPADSLANNLLDMPEGANAPKPAPLVKPEPEERSSAEIEAAFRGMDGGVVDEKAEELPVGEETIRFLNRKWLQSSSLAMEKVFIREYVVPGESVDAWTEMVIHQEHVVPTTKLKPAELAEINRIALNLACENLRWKINKLNASLVLFEWSHDGCLRQPPQEERSLYRVTKTGLCRWGYATKSPPMTSANRKLADKDLLAMPCG